MGIIVIEKGGDANRLARRTIEEEDYLQRYLYENPEVLPLDEIDDELVLLVLAREFDTTSGSIDAVGVDQNGDLYVIETKLYKNPDKRRVLAQALDYGAALWGAYEGSSGFREALDLAVRRQHGVSLDERIQAFFECDNDELTELLENVEQNRRKGRFRFVVLMDRMGDRLRNLITFINQNSQFTVYGVELSFYEHGDLDIVIPRLYGAEVRKDLSSAPSDRRRWDEESFLDEAEKGLSADHLAAVRRLLHCSHEIADEVSWGTGTKTGSFNAKFTSVSPRSVYTVQTDGRLYFNFKWLDPGQADGTIEALEKELSRSSGLRFPSDYRGRYVRFDVGEWAGKADAIIDTLRAVLRS